MNVALLCCGPSLPRTYRPGLHNFVIGVNRSACTFPCRIWASLDTPLIEGAGGRVRGDPILFTRRETYRALDRHGDRWGADRLTLFTEDLACPVPQWDLFTATAALVLAESVWAESIDVFGADWTPQPPAPLAENRSAERFEKERGIWDAVVGWLKGRGVEVKRIADHGTI